MDGVYLTSISVSLELVHYSWVAKPSTIFPAQLK